MLIACDVIKPGTVSSVLVLELIRDLSNQAPVSVYSSLYYTCICVYEEIFSYFIIMYSRIVLFVCVCVCVCCVCVCMWRERGELDFLFYDMLFKGIYLKRSL